MQVPGWFWPVWWALVWVALYAIFVPPGAARWVNARLEPVGWWFHRAAMERLTDERHRAGQEAWIVSLYVRSGDTEGLRRYLMR